MIECKELKTAEDFESLEKGDFVACEFHRDIHDHPKKYRFRVFQIVKVKTDDAIKFMQLGFNQTESVKMAKETILNNYKIFSC